VYATSAGVHAAPVTPRAEESAGTANR
jgi:hypothetical protein